MSENRQLGENRSGDSPSEIPLPGPEPIRRSIRIACGLLGSLVLLLGLVMPLLIPGGPGWGPLLFAGFASILLIPAFLSRRARTEGEWRTAFARAVHLSALTQALYIPGIGGMAVLYGLPLLWPDFSLAVQPGPVLGVLVVLLLTLGMCVGILANYYRAKAGI
jgi:hypothetical protein